MKWVNSNGLPLDKCRVSVELTREIEDEETGEIVDEQMIIVRGTFIPSDDSVGLGSHFEVESAHRLEENAQVSVELDDWEVDSLLGLLRDKLETERDRNI